MRKKIIITSLLSIIVLCSCRWITGDRHYFVKIVNNSDYIITVTYNRVIETSYPDVSYSYVPSNRTIPPYDPPPPAIEPYSETTISLSPSYFETFNGNPDKLRIYFIDKKVFDTAGERPQKLNPEEYLGYIDLTASEAQEINWTVKFPDDTINNMFDE